jgi:hypothetical protein
VLTSGRITVADILDGRWDNAAVELRRLKWSAGSGDPSVPRSDKGRPIHILNEVVKHLEGARKVIADLRERRAGLCSHTSSRPGR